MVYAIHLLKAVNNQDSARLFHQLNSTALHGDRTRVEELQVSELRVSDGCFTEITCTAGTSFSNLNTSSVLLWALSEGRKKDHNNRPVKNSHRPPLTRKTYKTKANNTLSSQLLSQCLLSAVGISSQTHQEAGLPWRLTSTPIKTDPEWGRDYCDLHSQIHILRAHVWTESFVSSLHIWAALIAFMWLWRGSMFGQHRC